MERIKIKKHFIFFAIAGFVCVAIFVNLYNFKTKDAKSAGWYNASWINRQKITISTGITSSNLTSFPILIAVTSTNDIFTDAQSDGDDILFTDSDGTTLLDYEIERFDNHASVKKFYAWVQVPTVSSSVNTDIYMYYNNSSASSNATSTGVWDSYEMVYHFDENPGGSETNTFQNGVSSYTGMTDITIDSASATTNQDAELVLKADGDACDSGICRALMKWDISSISGTCGTVDSASITVNVTNTTASRYAVFALRRAWVESEATYNVYSTGNSWTTAGASDTTDDRFSTDLMNGNADGGFGSASSGSRTHAFDSDGVQWLNDILDGTVTNNGLIIYNEAGDTDSYQWDDGDDEVTATSRPKLTVVCDTVSGDTYTDSSGGRHNVASAAKQAVVGSSTSPIWVGAEFDGTSSDFVEIANSTGFDSTSWTIEAVFNRQSGGVTASCGSGCTTDIYPTVTKGNAEADATGVDVSFHLGTSNATDNVAISFEESSVGTGFTDTGGTASSDDTWYYSAAVMDDSGNELEAWLNASSNGATTVNSSPSITQNNPVCFAAACNSTSAISGSFDGILDEIRFSRSVRSDDWVKASYRTIFGGGTYFTYAAEETQSSGTPNATQIHYRWRNDDGNETTATFGANEDTATTSVKLGETKRLRVEISNEGTGSTTNTYIMQWGTSSNCTSGTWTKVEDAGSCTGPFCLAASQLTEDALTTNVASGLTDENTSFIAGIQKETNATTSHVSLDTVNFTEHEYAIQITSQATASSTYYFRFASTTGATASTLDTYSQCPKLVTANDHLTQSHFRFRSNDNDEANASFSVAQDTASSTVQKSIPVRLRFEVSNEGNASSSKKVVLQYGTGSSPTSGTWTTVPATGACSSEAFCMSASQLVEGSATTNVGSGLTDENPTFHAGVQKESNATTSHTSINIDEFTEHEFSFEATTNAVAGTTYYFRLATTTDTAVGQLDSYVVTPSLVVASSSLDQIHYRFRTNDNDEANASFSVAQDTASSSVEVFSVVRLRIEVSNEGTASTSQRMLLQYGTGSNPKSGTWTTIPATGVCGSEAFCMTSSQLTDGSATTNVSSGLTDENSTFVASVQKEDNATTTHVSLESNNFTEIEFAFQATENATVAGTYYFRLATTTGIGDANQMNTYSVTPSLTIKDTTQIMCFREGQSSYAGTIDSDIFSSSATTNFGTGTDLDFDGDPADEGFLLRWDISAIPKGSSIQAATTTFYIMDDTTDVYEIYEVKRNWTEAGVTWNTYDGTNSWTTAGAQNTTNDRGSTALCDTCISGSLNAFATFQFNSSGLTEIEDWVDSPSTNYGITVQDYSNVGGGGVVSSEGTTAAQRPQLCVQYVAPIVDQKHYRWRNDDGTESSATFGASEDTATTSVGVGKVIRLRLEASQEALASSSQMYILQYGTSSNPQSDSWTTIPASGVCGTSPFCMNSSSLTEGSDTTDVSSGLTNENTTFTAGLQKETNATTTHISLASTNFTEIEYAFKITNQASANTTYYFRLATTTGDGTVGQLNTYSKTPALTTATTIEQNIDQKHYRWRNDNGTEVAATFGVNEDTATTSVGLDAVTRLRLEVSNESIASTSLRYILQYGTGSNPKAGTWTTVPTSGSCGSDAFCINASSLTDGSATTNVASALTDEATTFVAGEQKESNATTSHITLNSDEFTEVEFALVPTSNASAYTTYYFRLATTTGIGDFAELETYSQTPQLRTRVGTPTGFSATANGTTQIDLSWTAMTGATAYDIFQSTDNITFTLLGTSPTISSGSTTSYSDTGLTASTIYYYKIQSIETTQRSEISSSVNATTNSSSSGSSDSGGGGGGTLPGGIGSSRGPSAPTASQENPSGTFLVRINNGVSITNSRNVTLNMYAGSDTARMAISNFSDFHDAGQIPFQLNVLWDVCSKANGSIAFPSCADGIYEVYVRFFNSTGFSSPTVKASIRLNTEVSTEEVITPPEEIPEGQPSPQTSPVRRPVQPIPGQPQITPTPIITPKPSVPDVLKETYDLLTPDGFEEEDGIEAPELTPEDIPKVTPLAMKGEFELISGKKIQELNLRALPKDFEILAGKFPQLKKTFEQLEITKFQDLEKLKNITLRLPGFEDIVKFSVGADRFALFRKANFEQVPVEVKESLPTETMFVQASDGHIDQLINVSLGEDGKPVQSISTITRTKLKLAIIPEFPVEKIRGFVVVKNVRQSSESFFDKMFGTVFQARQAAAQSNEENIENRLVLIEFEYTDPDGDGIYTADIDSPLVSGEYEIITVMDYENPALGSREIRLITVVDPEGYVFEKIKNQELRIKGALVTLYWMNSERNVFEIWPAEEYSQINPQTTNERGTYSFLVPEGRYYLTAEAEGYRPYTSQEFLVEQGRGVHMNIEVSSHVSIFDILDWKLTLIIIIGMLLIFNFYKDTIRNRSKKENKK